VLGYGVNPISVWLSSRDRSALECELRVSEKRAQRPDRDLHLVLLGAGFGLFFVAAAQDELGLSALMRSYLVVLTESLAIYAATMGSATP
jgi:hypothetical protein